MKTEILGKNLKIKCYDNAGKSIDRYTVVFLDRPYIKDRLIDNYDAISMNSNPLFPTGVCLWTEVVLGRHLGKRISFHDLPVECQQAVKQKLGINN